MTEMGTAVFKKADIIGEYLQNNLSKLIVVRFCTAVVQLLLTKFSLKQAIRYIYLN